MDAMRSKGYRIEELCAAFEVSRSGYYGHLCKERAPRRRQDAQLRPLVARAFHESRRSYGTPRLRAALRRTGACLSRQRIARLMREAGLQPLQKRRRFIPRTTIADPTATPAANLLLEAAPPTRIDEVWVCDITYIPTAEGWLYLAAIMDLNSRKIVGWAMGERIDTGLILKALFMALLHRQPPANLIFHSDRGVQYASADYRRALAQAGFTASMSRKGNCYDNAVMESFWSTLKLELVYRRRFENRTQARQEIFDDVETFYNRQRIHSALGYLSPVDFETQNN